MTRRLRPARPGDLPGPTLDADSALVLAEAIDTLAEGRAEHWPDTHDGLRLHALASLLEQAERELPAAIARCRDHQLTWTQIGQLLGLTAATAAHRYRPQP